MDKRHLRVGIFVATGLFLVAIFVFVIGDARRLWSKQVTYQAAFNDVTGLKPGAPVRMGGVDVGSVTRVGQSDDSGDPLVYVDFTVIKEMVNRIRVDTVARIANKGLLGDKMVELTVAKADSPPLPPGGRLRTEEAADMMKLFSKFESIGQKAEAAVDNIERATRPLADAHFAEDVKVGVASLRQIIEGVATRDSAVHRLLLDPNQGVKVDRMLTELAGAVGELHGMLAEARAVVGHVRQGPGLVHALLYDDDMSRNATSMLKELQVDLRQIREGDGLGHAIFYGDEKTQRMVQNIVGVTDDVRAIVAHVRAGKGTLGGFLVDPSIYEDVKTLVGNLERNEVLRSLVRYSIKADDRKAKPDAVGAP
jgi:phospholipid/cholesterol/gamma-HCH transport system substrate-binding protein